MVSGKCVLKLVDPFSSLALMVNITVFFLSMFSCLRCGVNLSIIAKTIYYLLHFSIGELICPAYHELCNTDPVAAVSGQCPNSCNFNGDCVDGKCRCFLGFRGNDCSRRELSFFTFIFM